MSSKINNDINFEPGTEGEIELNDSRANENADTLSVRNDEDLGTHNRPKIVSIVKMVKKCKKRKRDEEQNEEKQTLSFRFYWREGSKTELFYGYRKRHLDQDGRYKARIYCNMQRVPKGQTPCHVSFIARCTVVDENSLEFCNPQNWETEVRTDQPLHNYIRYIFFFTKSKK